MIYSGIIALFFALRNSVTELMYLDVWLVWSSCQVVERTTVDKAVLGSSRTHCTAKYFLGQATHTRAFVTKQCNMVPILVDGG